MKPKPKSGDHTGCVIMGIVTAIICATVFGVVLEVLKVMALWKWVMS